MRAAAWRGVTPTRDKFSELEQDSIRWIAGDDSGRHVRCLGAAETAGVGGEADRRLRVSSVMKHLARNVAMGA